MFVDPDFPPNDSSLGSVSCLNAFTKKIRERITWKRITDLYSKPIQMFYNIHPNDIVQGNLGDCYLLSAISALAEFPDRVRHLFFNLSTTPNGKYKIGLYHEGIWTTYEIDDYFPCIGNTIAFSGPRFEDDTIELWVILLEKVWAKRYGGYFNIEEGFTEHALRDLTGAPVEKILTTVPNLWEILVESDRNRYIITGSIDNSMELSNSIGLVTLHAYSIIETKEYMGARLLQIRNPWGHHEFTGDWSDSSSKWTPEAKRALGWEDKDNGCFWMSINDFVRYFSSVCVCMANDAYSYTGLRTKANCFKVCLHVQSTAYFNVTQQGQGPVRIIVASNAGYVAGKSGVGKDVWVAVNCEFDDYYVYVERTGVEPFTFSVYSEVAVNIEETLENGFVQRIWNVEAAKRQRRCKKVDVAKGLAVYSCEMIGKNGREFYEGFVYDVIENSSKTDKAVVEVIVQESENIEVVGKTSMEILPEGYRVIVYRQVDLLCDYKLDVGIVTKMVPDFR